MGEETRAGAPAVCRRTTMVDGLETSYLEAGSGPTVVLLHGGEFGGEAEVCWERTIPALAEHFHVVAPDLLGFGQTAKVIDFVDGRRRRLYHLARFVEQVGAAGAPCVGNSMGGMLLLFDAASPDPLLSPAKIVSITGGGELTESEHTDALFSYDGSPQGMRKIVTALFHGKSWAENEEYVERRRQNSLAPGAWEAIAAARFRRPEPVQATRGAQKAIDYAAITVPTLIVEGADDKIKPPGWSKALTAVMPDARGVVVDAAGHCPQLEQPQIVNDLLIEFLSSEPSGAKSGS
ncbi:MAG: alpha/beta hydrolase [Comamonadaceae bacterium]|nr:MAG: alpha/beta hydrolase [Comamonadaceae bacterium]